MRALLIGLLALSLAAAPASKPAKSSSNLPPGVPASRPAVGTGVISDSDAPDVDRLRQQTNLEMAAARAFIESGKWFEAREALYRAQALMSDNLPVEEVRDLLTKIEQEGQRQLAAAEEIYGKKEYDKAIKAFGLISRTFGWLPSGQKARADLKRAEADPAAQSVLQEAKAAPMNDMVDNMIAVHFGLAASRPASAPAATSAPAAGKTPRNDSPTSAPAASAPAAGKTPRNDSPTSAPADTATQPALAAGLPADRVGRIKLLPVERQITVMDLLTQLSRLYPASDLGKQATADLEALKADKALMTAVAKRQSDQEPSRALSKADAYFKAGLFRQSLEYYTQVTQKYPDSPEAKLAAQKIGEVQAKLAGH